ncbi:MAG: MFS transporter [Coriobacteriia bacterium]|nr:MFS transporter [Coriobacteriia bacterium]
MADPGERRVPRNIKALGIVSLLTDASSEMVYPILPLFLANVLGAPVTAIGIIESVAETTASLMKVFSGWLSDRVGRRRPLIAFGYSLSNVVKPLLALTGSWPAVLLLRWCDRLGKGIRTAPRDALIADSSTEATRGRNFGVHRALDTLGAAIGPLTAWAILTLVPDGYRTIFWVSAIPGALAIAVVFFAVREKRAVRPDGVRPTLRLRHLGRPFALFTAVSFVFALGNSSDAMLILRAQDVGATPALIPLMYFAFNIVGATLSAPLGALSDRVGRKRLLSIGFVLYGAVYAGFALAGAPVHAWLLFTAYGVPYAMTEGMTRAYVVDLVGCDVRATAIGGYTFVLGLAALPASAVAGLLWDTVSHGAPFAVSAALMVTAGAALALTGRALPARSCAPES